MSPAAGHAEFVSEAEELLEALSGDVMEYESGIKAGSVKPALVNKIFREVHSLKGLAGMLGFQKISGLSHDLEDLLDRLRLGKVPASAAMVNVLFESIEALNAMVASVGQRNEEGDFNPTALASKIHDLAAPTEARRGGEASLDLLDLDESTRKSFTEYEEHRILDNMRQGNRIYGVTVAFPFETFDTDLKRVSDALNEKGEVVSTLPSSESASPDKISFRLVFASIMPPEAARALAEPLGGTLAPLLKSAAPAPPPPAPAAGAGEGGVEEILGPREDADLKSVSQTVRVDIEKLDSVMNVVGELVISKSAVSRLSRQLAAEHGLSPLAFELIKVSRALDRKMSLLQANVIDVRMVPIGQVFTKLARAVRKITLQSGKRVDLRFAGGDTELDKMLIEEITNPLLHIIRNAIDHGIEPPADRRAKGKTEEGVIHLKAYQRGNSVVIEVSDDGAGIRPEKIRAAAAKRGLVAADAELSFDDCVNLMFSPGFSSAAAVSDVSGRGVGLDVVKSNISRLKGSIQVRSEPDKGATFEIVLPITLAIMQVLLVEAGGRRFAIPLTSVLESLRVAPDQIRSVERREVYHLRQTTIPIIRLNRFFRLEEGVRDQGLGVSKNNKYSDSPLTNPQSLTPNLSSGRAARLYIVVVQAAERRVGLVVDRLAGEQEVVIKSVGRILSGLAGIAGVCELGENELVLVADVGSLLQKVASERGAEGRGQAAGM